VTPVIVSVRGTGTRFTRHLLGPGVDHVHIDGLEPLDIEQKLVVIPLRDPRAVWGTWWRLNRRKPMEYDLARFERDWVRISDLYTAGGCVRLPVDHQERETYLSALSAVIGRELATDWRPQRDGRIEDRGPPPEFDFARILNLPLLSGLYQ
jgi:hypothetical protein